MAKSSGESELYGVIRGSTEALGLVALASDLGSELLTRVHVDANAAKGMVERRGLSRVRHIEVDNLWIQEKEARRMLPLEKVAGGDNPADLMTKNVGIDLAIKHMTCMGIRFGDGRAESAAKLHCVALGEDGGNRGDDSWKSFDETLGEACAVREHRDWRRELFTPAGGGGRDCPRKIGDFAAIRRTVGVSISGKQFEVEDNWKIAGRAHRELPELWKGRTEFFDKAAAK